MTLEEIAELLAGSTVHVTGGTNWKRNERGELVEGPSHPPFTYQNPTLEQFKRNRSKP